MTHLRLFVLCSTSLAMTASLLLACSDDDTIITTPDGSVDGGTDTSVNQDSTVATDTSVPDAISDAGADVTSDATVVVAFPTQVATELCRTLARCCFGDANLDGGSDGGKGSPVDGGTFDGTKCMNLYTQQGWDDSNATGAALSRLTLNQTKGTECLQKIQALTCTQTPATEYQTLRSACYAALIGTQNAGDPCAVSAECKPGHFCNTSTLPDGGADAGAGTCEVVRATNAACGDWTNNEVKAQHTCSTRYSGDPPRYCETYDMGTGTLMPPANWLCKDARANGQLCVDSTWCSAGICDFRDQTCKTPVDLYSQTGCGFFVAPP